MTPAATTILGVPILTFLTFFPTVGALALLFLPSARPAVIRWFAFLVSAVTFLASIPLWTAFDAARRGMQFEERASWVPGLGISYHMGVDGISMLLILMTTFLTAIAILSSFSSITEKVKTYMANAGIEIVGSTPAEFGTFFRAEKDLWAKVVRETGAKID